MSPAFPSQFRLQRPGRKHLVWICLSWLVALPYSMRAQRYPILPVPNSPHGIFTMMQDSRSGIWLGTIDDVFLFDGTRFYSLRPFGFPRETTNSMAEDSTGGIWIATQGNDRAGGTASGGLYRYQAGHLKKIFTADGLSIVSIAPGVMLGSFGSEIQGRPRYGDLYRFREVGGSWKAELLMKDVVDHLNVDHAGNLLFPCPGGWCEIDHQAAISWQPQAGAIPVTKHSGSPFIERVLRDKFGCVWLRAEAFASYQCPGMAEPAAMPQQISKYDSSAHLEEAADGSIFMLVSLALGRPGAFQVATLHNGMPPDMDSAMLARDGTIWLGTDSGLMRFAYPFQLEYWSQNEGIVAPFSVVKVGSQLFTTTKGIVRLSLDRTRWISVPGTERWSNPQPSLFSIPGGRILALFRDDAYLLHPDGSVIAHGHWAGGTESIISATSTKSGSLWLGDQGVSRLTIAGSTIRRQFEDVPRDWVTDMQYDATRDVLYACDGKRLLIHSDDKWRSISQHEGLVDANCHTIGITPAGDVWIGYDIPIYSLIKNASSPSATIRNFSEELYHITSNNGTAFLGADKRGWIWRGTYVNYVASPAAAESGGWLRLDEQDGFSVPGTDHSFLGDEDGSIWYSSNDRVVHFSPPSDFVTSFPVPPIFLSGFTAGQSAAVLADATTAISHTSSLIAHLGSLQFDRRNNVRIRYRLLPEQAAWQTASGFDLDFGNPKWGSHTLEVQAALSTGQWSPLKRYEFTVLKPIWLTWPALLTFTGIGVLTGSVGTARYKRRVALERKSLPDLAEWRLASLVPEGYELVGTTLDERFSIDRILARGGFATVFSGVDLKEDRPCAVKVFRRELAGQAWLDKQFRQEVAALEAIHHRNVVQVYGHGSTASGTMYLAMEFIDGQTLREALTKGPLPGETTAALLRQAGSALDRLHDQRIYHRDLKPENIMLRRGSEPGSELVLVDFSIAIVKNADESIYGLSRAAGTLNYMAPEQVLGYADESSDIYSLAKILIEMLTGRPLSELLPDASLDLPQRIPDLLNRSSLVLSPFSVTTLCSALEFDPAKRPRRAGVFTEQIANDLTSR